MSMMRCDYCEAFIDTDYDVEGEYEDASNKFRCSACCEERDIETVHEDAVQQAAERKRLAEQELQAAQLAYHDACGEYEAAVAATGWPDQLTNTGANDDTPTPNRERVT